MHELEVANANFEKQLTIISRSATRMEASLRLQSFSDQVMLAAQHGEELFLWNLLNFSTDGCFIEIGAYDGKSLSNSLFFEQIGWRGILIEAHPELVQVCRKNRPLAKVVHAALGESTASSVEFSMVRGEPGLDTLSFVSSNEQHHQRIKQKGGAIEKIRVPSGNLSGLLESLGITQIDWVSIDVEGAELSILKGIDFVKYRPKVLMIEANSKAEYEAVNMHLLKYGFKQFMKVGCNVIFKDMRI